MANICFNNSQQDIAVFILMGKSLYYYNILLHNKRAVYHKVSELSGYRDIHYKPHAGKGNTTFS